ncbi:MAG: thioredoxin-disulfide reductase [Myxococcota bacterium]
MTIRDLIIIGAGPAGYTAAIYAARAGLSPLLFTGAPTLDEPQRLAGGQLMSTTLVENYPGFPEPVAGVDLMQQLERQAQREGAELSFENVLAVELRRWPFTIRAESGSVLARALIVATGASARWLGVPGEQEYRNRGVSACAACDGAVFKDRDVIVVGGGDTAMQEALYLSKLARSVRLLHRRKELSASTTMVRRVLAEPKIAVLYDTTIEEVVGDGDALTGVRVINSRGGERRQLHADALFVAIGHEPATSLLEGQLELDELGYIATHAPHSTTSVAGVFAAGDVQDHHYRQAITAAGSGAVAALDAERWLAVHAKDETHDAGRAA